MSDTTEQTLADAMSLVCADDGPEASPKTVAKPKTQVKPEAKPEAKAKAKSEPVAEKSAAAPRRIVKTQTPVAKPAPVAGSGRKVTQTTTRSVTKQKKLRLPRAMVSSTGRIKRLEVVTTESGEEISE